MSSLTSQCRLLLPRPDCRRLRSGQASTSTSTSLSHARSRPQLSGLRFDRRPFHSHLRRSFKVQLIDDNFDDFPSLIEEDPDFLIELHSSSDGDGDESDDDSYVNPYMDVDFPTSKKERLQVPDAALAAAAHSLRGSRRGHRKRRIRVGMTLNFWLISFIGLFLLWFDWCSWRIVRLPLKSLFLTRPFIVSALISACAGFLYTPLLENLKIYRIVKKVRSDMQFSYKVKPTMGGLFFIPIGVIVGVVLIGKTSEPVNGSIIATLAFGAIGLFDDILRGAGRHDGFPGWLKLTIQIAYLGSLYFVATILCFLSIPNGVTVTDDIDGLATGTAALAFLGMSGAILALSPELAVFGSSMAGGCIGFLFHNRYKASVVMGQTGFMALGGALVSMASCSGMFFPLFIATSPFVIESFSMALQIFSLKVTKRNIWFRKNFSCVVPVHGCLKLLGLKETVIVGGAYVLSFLLALLAGYVGIISS